MSELSEPVGARTPTRQRRLRYSLRLTPLRGVHRIVHLLIGLVLSPFYLIAGAACGVPGVAFRRECFFAGMRLFMRGDLADAYHCIVAPMDSVRHFEMDFFWRRARALRPAHILDVSSPRLFTLLLMRRDPCVLSDLLNPDRKDLERTRSLAKALKVYPRCNFVNARIDSLASSPHRYPLVACMSVLEHIVDDMEALRIMWDRVAPGGRLLLSVPCAATMMDEFTNVDDYGLLEHDDEGFVFWQRYYDETRLQALFAIAGQPLSKAIYAEREAGVYDADVEAKRENPRYPRWREPYATARAYTYRDNVSTLPGMGVIAMEFAKLADQ